MEYLSSNTESQMCTCCGENEAVEFYQGSQWLCQSCIDSLVEDQEIEEEKENAFNQECEDRQNSVLHIEEVLERNSYIYDKHYSNGTSVYFEVQAGDLDIKVRLADHCMVYDADITVAYKGFESQNADATSLESFESVLESYISKHSN